MVGAGTLRPEAGHREVNGGSGLRGCERRRGDLRQPQERRLSGQTLSGMDRASEKAARKVRREHGSNACALGSTPDGGPRRPGVASRERTQPRPRRAVASHERRHQQGGSPTVGAFTRGRSQQSDRTSRQRGGWSRSGLVGPPTVPWTTVERESERQQCLLDTLKTTRTPHPVSASRAHPRGGRELAHARTSAGDPVG